MIAFGCVAILAAMPGCSPRASNNADVRFAKTAFFSMVNGSSDAQTMIDWENFRAIGDDVGKEYQALPSDAEKSKYRNDFIAGIALSTPAIKANPDGITNWRVQRETPLETVVAANMNGGAILTLTVSKRDGIQRLSAIDMKK